jgi:hypothetical protein
MPVAPIYIQSITLTGFRAYLEPKEFDLSQKHCLAVFAPNGHGKSGIADAVEFLLSEEGTIKRLGVRTIHNKGGVAAIAHNLADEKGLIPEVHIALKQGKTKTDGARKLSGGRERPPVIAAFRDALQVVSIIRGYELRKFVEDQTPEDRYAEIADWLRLAPLVDVQRNLRLLRQQIKADLDDLSPRKNIDDRTAKTTDQVVKAWNEDGAITFANSLLVPLDKSLAIKSFDETDAAYLIVCERNIAEDTQLGVAGLRQISGAVLALFQEVNNAVGTATASGAICDFEKTLHDNHAAQVEEQSERANAADAIFTDVWAAATQLFADGSADFQNCPVCFTPFDETSAGSKEAARNHIEVHRAKLAAYTAARDALDRTAVSLSDATTKLRARLSVLDPVIRAEDAALREALSQYSGAIDAWSSGEAPDASTVKALLARTYSSITNEIDEIQRRQGDSTYARAQARIDALRELNDDYRLMIRAHIELEALHGSLGEQATFVSGEIRKKLQDLLDAIRQPVNDLYRSIQGAAAAPVRLELPPEDDSNQQRLLLLIDFKENRMGVAPAGYLSDSQIHSLALALRLAAIRAFNAAAPFANLDDIVTSYDADHRRAIAGMLAEKVSGLQLIITTHDQRFFNYLKDQLPAPDWAFTQITRLDADYGPRFTDHRMTNEDIQARWDAGKSAANEIRQAEEEWLLGCCRSFGVDIRIRDTHRAHSYERSELATALATFLKKAGLTPPAVPGVANRFLISLQKGEVENFGSHFQDGPYGDGSVGDEKTRWAEFTYFRDHFSCPKCSARKFKRPLGMSRGVCEKCETPFAFAPATTAPSVAAS